MTKRILWAPFLLFLCISFCLSSYAVTKKCVNSMTEDLTQLSQLILNGDNKSMLKAKQCKEKWNKMQCILNIFLDHLALETVSLEIPSIEKYIIEGYSLSAYSSTLNAINSLEQIMNEQQLSIGNVF